jgi:plastocyanin
VKPLRKAFPASARFLIILTLLGAVVFLLACAQDTTVRRRSTSTLVTSTATSTGPVAADEIHIKNFEFIPQRLVVKVGTQVVWINDDGTNHIITDSKFNWRVGILAPGGSGAFQFDNPGEHVYTCSIHPSMRGTLVVE